MRTSAYVAPASFAAFSASATSSSANNSLGGGAKIDGRLAADNRPGAASAAAVAAPDFRKSRRFGVIGVGVGTRERTAPNRTRQSPPFRSYGSILAVFT